MVDGSNFDDEEFENAFDCTDSTIVTNSDTDNNDLEILKT